MDICLLHRDGANLGRAEIFVNDNSSNLCLVLFCSDNSLFCGIYPYGKKQMSDFYPEHEEFPHHRQDRAAIGRDPASEAVIHQNLRGL